ncbi:hypothetical protein KP509_21G062200 [Ceratopteris richardii]|nr:hypothetical protein KP509_21G062200 [Ceratopteris richardii]
MQRLNKTKSWVVSLKCLALLHRSLQRGGFMYEDQVVLRFSPRNGAKNHLNLSKFRDDSSALAWQASSWIRWYAGYLETLIKASANPPIEVNALISTTDELMSKIVALDMLLNELGTCPSLADAASALASHTLIQDTFRLIVKDYANKRELLHYCLKEMSENRIPELSGPQITQLLHACKTLSSTGASYGTLNELALSFKVAVPLPLLDHVTSTEQELLNMSEVYTAAALRLSDAALQGKCGALIKYVAPSDPLTPPKLPGPAIFRHSKVVSSQ